jgi:Fe-S cluster biogenesis protein NfuA
MRATAQGVGDRIEQLLESLRPGKDKEIAEELVRLLVEMYGEGLTRITGVISSDSDLMDRLVKDDLVESLLLLHDLHPVDVQTRIQRALDGVRPFLGSHAGGVEFLGVDEEGIAQLSLQGSCEGCPSSTLTVKMAIETAIMQAAPDINGIEVAGVTSEEPGLLQVRMGPPPDWHAPGVVCPATKAEVS